MRASTFTLSENCFGCMDVVRTEPFFARVHVHGSLYVSAGVRVLYAIIICKAKFKVLKIRYTQSCHIQNICRLHHYLVTRIICHRHAEEQSREANYNRIK